MRKPYIFARLSRLTPIVLAGTVASTTYVPVALAQQTAPAPAPTGAPAPAPTTKAPQPPAATTKPAPAAAPTTTAAPAAPPKEPDQATKNAARVAYAGGEKAYKAGNYANAYQQFRNANELIPTVHAEYWMAMSLSKDDKKGEAYDALQALLANPEHSKLGADKIEAAKAALAELQKVPATVTLSTVPENATVSVDEQPREGQSPFALELVVGKHQITVNAEGYEPSTVDFNLRPGESIEQTVELTKSAPPPPPPPPAPAPVAEPAPAPPPAPPPQPERSLVPAYVTLGIAGASAIVGTIFGIQALSKKSDFDDNPTTENADDAERNALIADMAFGVTITLGITGIVLLTSDDDTQGEISKSPSPKLNRARLDVTPYAGPNGGGAAARYTF